MFRFFVVLIILCCCLAVGYFASTFSGEVLILLDGKTIIETNLIKWLILSLGFSWLLILFIRLIIALWRVPKYFSHAAKIRKHNKAQKHLQAGLAELISGHYSKAEKHFVKGGDLVEEIGESSVIYFENAAIAANYLGAEERRQRYLLHARQYADVKHTTLTRLTEAEIHVKHGEYNTAIPLLEKLCDEEGKNLKVLNLLLQCYQQTAAWEKAWRILPKLRESINEAEYKQQQKTCAQGMLRNSATGSNSEQIEAAWKTLPTDIRQDCEMILLYAGALVENGQDDVADKLLAQEIKNTQHISLIQAYSQLRSGHFQERLNNMEQWESQHQNDALFLYAKALIAYRAKAYDKASLAIESSLQLHPTAEAFALWAQILEVRNQPEAALAAYRQSIVNHAADGSIIGDLLPAPEQPKTLDS